MAVIAGVGAIAVVVSRNSPEVPRDFGAGQTKVKEWNKGRDTWARLDSARLSSDGKLRFDFSIANKGATKKTYDLASFELTVIDHKGGKAQTNGVLDNLRFFPQAPEEVRTIHLTVFATTDVLIAKGGQWACTVILSGRAFGEADFQFVIRGDDR